MITGAWLVPPLALAIAACSTSTATPNDADAGTDSSGGAMSDADASRDGDASNTPCGSDASQAPATCDAYTTCNGVANCASTVTTTQAAGDQPPFTGGTVVDGTYHLVAVESYGSTGAVGEVQRVTFAFASGVLQMVQDSADCNAAPTGTANVTTSGNQLDVTMVCPFAGSVGHYFFTATATELAYGSSSGGASGLVFRFTKQ